MKIASIKPLNDGIIDTAAEKLWSDIEGFAAYSFNKSHSVEYCLISYQAMWLKVKHPTAFYSAALTLMDEEKLPALLREAKATGLTIDTPDINESGHHFCAVTPTRLVMPFQRIKGLSDKTTAAILEARNAGPFLSKQDFIDRVARRTCNARHQDLLDLVGAFSRIEPGQKPSDDESRVQDQIELLPGLITAHVKIYREMHRDKTTKQFLAALIDDYRGAHGPTADNPDGMPVRPSVGATAQVMVISDAPGGEEERGGLMGLSMGSQTVIEAAYEAGLDRPDLYWTALVKRVKSGKQISPEEISTYAPYLDREIEILKPPIIVLLGSMTVRHFIPGFKGKASDAAGTVIYDKVRDANLVVGFNPGEIYHAPEKQEEMNKVFASVVQLLN